MSADTEPAEIFLSYSRTTSEVAQLLFQRLVAAGRRVFKDNESIRCGDRWLEKLQAALSECQVFIVLVEPAGLERWTLIETLTALRLHVDSDRRIAQQEPDSAVVPLAAKAFTSRARPCLLPILMNGANPDMLPVLLRQHQAFYWDASDDEDTLGKLFKSVRDVLCDEALPPPQPPKSPPFKGLLPFEQSDQPWFYGRHADTLDALSLLGNDLQSPERPTAGIQQCRWLCITGASGSGKSSLLRAALVPLLRQGALWGRTGLQNWRVTDPLRPGPEPLRELALALERAWVDNSKQINSDELLRRLRSGPRALDTWLRERHGKGQLWGTVICVDQGEELFTQSSDEERELFDQLLAVALSEERCCLYLVMTIRSDHQHLLDRLPTLAPLQNTLGRVHRLNPLSPAQLRMTIEGPAQLAGLDVRELANVVVMDAHNDPHGALPLVQHALDLLYQQRQGNVLSLDLYHRLGGLAGMLRQQAEAALSGLRQLSDDHERGALALLRALSHFGPEGRHTRRHLTREAAVRQAGLGHVPRGEQVLKALEAARLVVGDGEHCRGTRRVELSHETLLRRRDNGEPVWPKLYEHLNDTQDMDWERENLYRQSREWAQARWWQRPGMAMGVTQRAELWRLWRLRHLADTSARSFLRWSAFLQASQVMMSFVLAIMVFHGLHWTGMIGGHPLEYAWRPVAWSLGIAEPWPDVVPIPSPTTGRFTMGCKPGRDDIKGIACAGDERPRDEPLKQRYSLGRTEVSFLEYDFYVWSQHKAGVYSYPTIDGRSAYLGYPPSVFGRGEQPLININWYEARAYLKWLTSKRAPAGMVYRLPSEVEWEYAARAEDPSNPHSRPGPFWWGTSFPSEKPADGESREAVVAVCNGCSGSADILLPVNTLPANPFGLNHMNGNVWEWTDYLHDPDETTSDPRPVLRGGSWLIPPQELRASLRNQVFPDYWYFDIGFRVCLSAPMQTAEAAMR